MFFGRKLKTTGDRHTTTRTPRLHPTRPERKRLRPGVEALEGRLAMAAPSHPLSTSFLFHPIPDGTPLAEHIHFLLQIQFVHPTRSNPDNIQVQKIPATVGHVFNKQGRLIGFDPIHTHTSDGVIHVESTVARPFHLSDFFLIWHKVFTKNQILDHKATPGHPIEMFVAQTNGTSANGYEDWYTGNYTLVPDRTDYGHLLLTDGEVIVIRAD